MSRADSLERTRADSLGRMERMRQDSMANIARLRQDSIDAVARRQADSVAAIERARADSVGRIERARADSVAAVEAARRDSVARADSLAREDQMRRQRQRDRYLFNGSGWYIGVSGGSAMPTGDFEDLGYDTGFNVNVPIGWHGRSSFMGVRLDLGYSQFGGGTFSGTGAAGTPVVLNNADPKVLTAALNVTARVPLNGAKTWHLYGVGGAGIHHFRSFGRASALGGFLGNDVLDNNDETVENVINKFGAQFGGGIDFGVGPASLFIESRVVNVFADRDDNVQFGDFFGSNRSKTLRWVPIVLGVTFR
jgi:hypothetical protein